ENCRAKDGRIVRLAKKRHDDHILDEHPDLARDFAYPASEIQKALESAEDVSPGSRPNTMMYLGPPVMPNGIASGGQFGHSREMRRFRVVVQTEEGNTGFVTTAYAPVVSARGKVR
ncbi:MAG TPA: hypothetical protein VNZ26_26875, partial [Vicinamibacterales bacterium]|nr:hypothetical protein [Vicinamibacterales bacterium]